MGLTQIQVTISAKHSVTIDALVDTGATFTVLPQSIAKAIDIETPRRCVVTLADNRKKKLPAGLAYIKINGREAPAVVLVIPEGEPLIGAETLEALGLAIDPRKKKLKAVHPVVLLASFF